MACSSLAQESISDGMDIPPNELAHIIGVAFDPRARNRVPLEGLQSSQSPNFISSPSPHSVANSGTNPTFTTNIKNKSSRIRQYCNEFVADSYSVIIREKGVKFSPVKFATYINHKYKSVKLIKRNHDSMKVTFGDREQANRICIDPFFFQYIVTIPADLVEVTGAINHSDLCDLADINEIVLLGKGRFANRALMPCNILEAQILSKMDPTTNTLIPTNTVKIIFSGQVLPKYIEIEGLLVQVRPFIHKPMFCDKCQMFGHTMKFCRRAPKCPHCADPHIAIDCKDARANNPVCPYCLTTHEGGRFNCAYFREVATSFKNKESVKRKSRYKQAVAASRNHPAEDALVDFPPLENAYATLSDDDEDDYTLSVNPAACSSDTRAPPAPPVNIYDRQRTQKRSLVKATRTAPKRRRDDSPINTSAQSQRINMAPPHHKPTIAKKPSFWTTPKINQANSSSAAIKAAIMSAARANLSPTWLPILESFIDPLLEAIMPLLPSILASCLPSVINNSSKAC